MKKTKAKRDAGISTRNIVYIALFVCVITVCSWISVPSAVPFTLQTFGVFCAAGMLGGKRGSFAVLVYILLGAVGAPVFSGFNGGIGYLCGLTGGYIVGFLFASLAYWVFTALFGKRTWSVSLGMVIGLIVCYAFGTAWFMFVYAKKFAPIGVMDALLLCVFPFILPDFVKIALAVFMTKTVAKRITAHRNSAN